MNIDNSYNEELKNLIIKLKKINQNLKNEIKEKRNKLKFEGK